MAGYDGGSDKDGSQSNRQQEPLSDAQILAVSGLVLSTASGDADVMLQTHNSMTALVVTAQKGPVQVINSYTGTRSG